MLNRISIMGRLTAPPELKYTQSGIAVCTFSIACERDFKSENGEKQTDFFTVVAWKQTAEFVTKYLDKGRMIIVDGRLQARPWQDKYGNHRISVEIVAEHCYFGDSKRTDGGTSSNSGYSGGYGGGHGGASYLPTTEMDEDEGGVPF